jgi:carbamoylphosphate synthase small subunit
LILREIIDSGKKMLEYNTPVLGICMGLRLIALASGGDEFRLRYEHRRPTN